MKKRLRETAVKYSIVFGIAAAYLIWVLCTDIGIPCPLYSITGFQCPGCGVSRMLAALFKFDFAAAFTYNPFLMIVGPVILAYITFSEVKYVRLGDRSMGKWNILLWVILAATIIFGILRNIL